MKSTNKPLKSSISASSRNTRRGYYWISRLAVWMVHHLGYKVPRGCPSIQGSVDSIWSKFAKVKQSELGATLNAHKLVRNWFMKSLGASGLEYRILSQRAPKGTYPWMFTVLKEMRSANHTSKYKSLCLRWVLTLLYSTRVFTTTPAPDYDPIVSPPTYEVDVLLRDRVSKRGARGKTRTLTSAIRRFWRALGFRKVNSIPAKTRFTKFHLTYKAGPKGPALENALEDWLSLPSELKEDLRILGGPRFEDIANQLEEEIHGSSHGPIRRLSFFSDLEGKTRVIGILDYFSQTILRPLHLWVFGILSRIPQDCTFNQNSFIDKIKGWPEYFSCDLTNATDRFPILLQEQLLSGLFPKKWTGAWRRVMVGHPFAKNKHEGGDTYYNTGNPMGAYSSWAVFSLTHHFLVFWACLNIGRRWTNSKYCILGDDIIFGDKELYLEYRILLREIGVEVSDPKTHESRTLLEFAKRWVYLGEEITPLPLPAFVQGRTQYHLIVPLLVAEQRRGLVTPKGVSTAYIEWYKMVKGLSLQDFYTGITGKKPSMTKAGLVSLKRRAVACETIAKFFSGILGPRQCIDTIAYEWGCRPLKDTGDEDLDKEMRTIEYGMLPFVSDQTKTLLKRTLKGISDEILKVPSLVRTQPTPDFLKRPPSYRTSWEVLVSRAPDYEGVLRNTTLAPYLGFKGRKVSEAEKALEAMVESDVDFIPWFAVWADLVNRYTEYNIYENQPPKTRPSKRSPNHQIWKDNPWRSPLLLRAVAMPAFDTSFKGRKEMVHSVIAGKFAKAICSSFDKAEVGSGTLRVRLGIHKAKPVEIEFELH